MKKLVFLSFALLCFNYICFAQELPPNTCGIVNIYDAAGNRTKRVYFCNNGQPYPTKPNAEIVETSEVQQVDALYPNPTSGRFSVYFSKELKQADILLTDINGKVIKQFKASGTRIDFDLSIYAAGVYFVRIRDGKNIITKKVVKQ